MDVCTLVEDSVDRFRTQLRNYVLGMELWENCVPMQLGKVHFAISFICQIMLIIICDTP